MTVPSEEHITHLGNLMPDINSGNAIPIISNSFRIEELFADEKELHERITAEKVDFDEEDPDHDEMLTKKWADDIKYPMSDSHSLARVAQYFQVQEKNNLIAKSKYLTFLKNHILTLNESNEEHAGYIKDVRPKVQQQKFSSILKSLDYPRFSAENDPLRLLAKLPIKVFITTSYFDSMERALREENKSPHSLVCFWSNGESKASPEHRKVLDPDKDITEDTPLVYHLFGLEDYPNTLVLSEDDYMNFLVSVFENKNNLSPLVPTFLKDMLGERALILLGYHLRDWDFRVLFKFIMKYRKPKGKDMTRSILIQLKPSPHKVEDEVRSVQYLEQYFDDNQFDVDWTRAEHFIHELWKMHDQNRGRLDHE